LQKVEEVEAPHEVFLRVAEECQGKDDAAQVEAHHAADGTNCGTRHCSKKHPVARAGGNTLYHAQCQAQHHAYQEPLDHHVAHLGCLAHHQGVQVVLREELLKDKA
jgi:hypothetical protein